MAAPERLRWFVLRVALGLVLCFVLWPFAEPWVLKSLWVLSDLLWPHLFFDGRAARVDVAATVWQVHTGWPTVPRPGQPTLLYLATLDLGSVKRMASGFPLLLALMLATPGRRPLRVVAALAGLWVVAWFTLTASIWHTLVVASGTPGQLFSAVPPPQIPLQVTAAAPWQLYVSGYLMYLALLIVPFIAPVLVWAVLMREPLLRMVLGSQARYQQRRSQGRLTG